MSTSRRLPGVMITGTSTEKVRWEDRTCRNRRVCGVIRYGTQPRAVDCNASLHLPGTAPGTVYRRFPSQRDFRCCYTYPFSSAICNVFFEFMPYAVSGLGMERRGSGGRDLSGVGLFVRCKMRIRWGRWSLVLSRWSVVGRWSVVVDR